MATDIAFAVAIVTVLGRRIPASARTFILTLAVVDDIGGIIVIAVFYSSGLSWGWLATSATLLALVGIAQRLNIRAYGAYLPLAAGAWYALHESGVHATISGVVIGLLTPTAAFHDPARFPGWARPLVDRIELAYADQHVSDEEHAGNEAALRDMIRLSMETLSPLQRHEYLAGPWVTYLIVPVFALANAGVRVVNSGIHNPLTDRVALAPAVGLVAGKTIGVLAASAIAVKTGLVRLPRDVTWPMMTGLAATAGIGFTVALFITNLSFDLDDVTARAKLGVLLGSTVAGALGWLTLRASTRPAPAS
jgi:NhaA family Na+:H+ antiporter